MPPAVRTVRILQFAFVGTVVLYVVIGERFARVMAPNIAVYYGISVASISVIGAIFVVRRTLLANAEDLVRMKPQDVVALGRWRAGYIVTYALCESIGVFGLVLRFLGFPLSQTWSFYLGAVVLLLLFGPREPKPQPSA